MNKTESYLRERFDKTHWPYYGLLETKFHIGSSFDQDVKELREKEMIQPWAGLNGWLIEIIDWNTKWSNSQTK